MKHIATNAMLRGPLLNAVYDEEVTPIIQLEKEEYVVMLGWHGTTKTTWSRVP